MTAIRKGFSSCSGMLPYMLPTAQDKLFNRSKLNSLPFCFSIFCRMKALVVGQFISATAISS
jgi:hypothetical protein